MENGPSVSLIDAARLHADVTVLHDIDPADPMLRSHVIEFCQEFCRRKGATIDSHRIAARIVDFDIFRPIERLFHVAAPNEHVFWRLLPWIFEDAALV